MNDIGKMTGRRVLVTGSDTGIGPGVALAFAREGAAVALHYPYDETGPRAAVDEIRRAGGKAEAFETDFKDIAQVKGLAA
jgi:NAD(P)-dependent dehydrogenase (short-subunit alcohol dehydrogenase family)